MTNERKPQLPSSKVSVEQPAAQAPEASALAPVVLSPALVEPPAVPAPPLPDTTIDRAQIEAICGGYHGSPFDVLGPHMVKVKGK